MAIVVMTGSLVLLGATFYFIKKSIEKDSKKLLESMMYTKDEKEVESK